MFIHWKLLFMTLITWCRSFHLTTFELLKFQTCGCASNEWTVPKPFEEQGKIKNLWLNLIKKIWSKILYNLMHRKIPQNPPKFSIKNLAMRHHWRTSGALSWYFFGNRKRTKNHYIHSNLSDPLTKSYHQWSVYVTAISVRCCRAQECIGDHLRTQVNQRLKKSFQDRKKWKMSRKSHWKSARL